MNMGSEDVNEDLFGLEDEDFGEEINSRMNVTNISSGEMVVQNRRSRKMYQTTTNDAYKKEARERACMLITRWMYEAVIPFNAVTYPSFQPMIEAIGQYGVGMKGPTFHEVRVTNLKKELALTKDLMKDHMVEWGKNGCLIMLDGWTDRKERTLVNFWLLNMMRRFTRQRELLRPTKTRFAIAFITLSRLHEQKNNLRKMFTSSNWSDIRVLRLVDGEKNSYEVINRAKDTIVRSFNRNEEKYKEIFNIIDKRLTRDPAKQKKVVAEVSLYRNSQGLFGNELAVRRKKTRAPVEWWAAYGASAPNLQRFAKKVLNLTCGASGCERNWSIFEDYNRALKRRYNECNTIDPISLKDIDNSNEWLIGRMEDEDSHGGAQDDFVFDDDNLTWDDVANEDEDGDMVDSTDEEYGEGYKCGDGNDDDGDFVDLEE
ncbi:hypothetical protein AAG906_003570 [Vitis piasezkii]